MSRRVSDVISMSSIRRFRVKHRVSPFSKAGRQQQRLQHQLEQVDESAADFSSSYRNGFVPLGGKSHSEIQPRCSVPAERNHHASSKTHHRSSHRSAHHSSSPPPGLYSLQNGGSGGATKSLDLKHHSPSSSSSGDIKKESTPNSVQNSNANSRRNSIDQAIDVSRLLRTVEELFTAVRTLFNPNQPTQFLAHQSSSSSSSLNQPPSETSTANSEESTIIDALGAEVEEELEEMAERAEAELAMTIKRHSIDAFVPDPGISEGADPAAIKIQPDAINNDKFYGAEGRSEMRAPVTAAIDSFSPQPKRRQSQNAQLKAQQTSIGPAEKDKIPAQKQPVPSYGELFARNQQFDCRYQPVQPILIENFASTFCNTCAYLFAALFVAIPIYLFLFLIIPFAAFARLCQRLFCFELKAAKRMSALETSYMLDLFAAGGVCTSLIVLNTKQVADPVVALKQALMSEIIDKREGSSRPTRPHDQPAADRHAKRIYRRFRQKPIRIGCDMFGWQDDESFVIDRHFVPHSRQRFASVAELEQCLSDLSSQGLPDDRPPWQIQYVENFGGPGSILLICRHHMAMADGVSLVNMLHAAFAKNGRNPAIGHFDDWPPMHHLFTGSTYDFNCLRSSLVGPITVLAAHGVEPHPLNQAGVADPPDSPKTDFDKFELILSDPMNLDCCTVIKQITHSSLNEIFLSLLAGSIRCYLQHHAIANPPDLKAILPVNLSRNSYPDSLGSGRGGQGNHSAVEFCPKLQNRYTFSFFKLPVSTEGAVSRLWAVRKRYEQFSNSSDSASIDTSLKLADLVTAPASYHSFARQLFASGFCLVSNLAGSPCQLNIGGCQVSALMFWMPPPSGCNLSFSLFSYRNEVRLGVMARTALMPRPKILTSEFTRQLQQLYEQVAVRTLSMELDTLFPDFTLSAMTQSTIQELEQLLVPIQTQLMHLKAQIDAGDRSLVTLQQIRRLQDRFRCLLIKIKQQQAIRNVAHSPAASTISNHNRSSSAKNLSGVSENSITDAVINIAEPPHQALSKSTSSSVSRQRRSSSSSNANDNSQRLSVSRGSVFGMPQGNPNNLSPKSQRSSTARNSAISQQPLPPNYPQPPTSRSASKSPRIRSGGGGDQSSHSTGDRDELLKNSSTPAGLTRSRSGSALRVGDRNPKSSETMV